jgi:PRC-barrel domain protein
LKGPDGKIAAAVISVSRVLGIGEKDVAVPFSALKTEQLASGRIVLDVTRDGLQLAPAFQH